MNVLIVEDVRDLAELWKRHLEREKAVVHIATTSDQAIDFISSHAYEVIVVDLLLSNGDSGLAVADYAQYRRPEARVIVVSDNTFFSDGSIFEATANARALVRRGTAPEDLAAMVEHYGTAPS